MARETMASPLLMTSMRPIGLSRRRRWVGVSSRCAGVRCGVGVCMFREYPRPPTPPRGNRTRRRDPAGYGRGRTGAYAEGMETRVLGPSSLSVSVVGLGCNNLGRPGTASHEQKGSNAVVGAAIEAGVTFFDTADIYGAEYGLSETRLGVAIKGKRDQLFLATK